MTHLLPFAVRARSSGFTLIEAMVSVSIIVVGMMGLFVGYSAMLQNDVQGRKISQASALAQAVGHALLLQAWSSPALVDKSQANNGDVDDQARAFSGAGTPSNLADHQLKLAGLSAPDQALQLDALDALNANEALDYNGGGGANFEVYWNVADCSVDSTAVPWTVICAGSVSNPTLKQIGIIVRWRNGGGPWFEVSTQTQRAITANMGM